MAVFGNYIFTETDLSYRLISAVFADLEGAGLLAQNHQRTVTIDVIASRQGNNVFNTVGNFSRTASAVLRMCFLRSVDVNVAHWPNISRNVFIHNRNNMVVHVVHLELGVRFQGLLIESARDARIYYSRYDQLHPHFFIEQKMEGAQGPVQWERGMTIFMNNLAQLAVITTAVEIQRAGNTFNCQVTVSCTHYNI